MHSLILPNRTHPRCVMAKKENGPLQNTFSLYVSKRVQFGLRNQLYKHIQHPFLMQRIDGVSGASG